MRGLIIDKSENNVSLLRDFGFKVTPQRLSLLAILSAEKKPLTVSQLSKKLRSVNQITIYRTLEAMVLRGLVRKVNTLHAYTHYELVATRKHHHHVICSHCGMIEDVDLCLPRSLEGDVLKNSTNFASISGHSLEFTGTCNKCTSN